MLFALTNILLVLLVWRLLPFVAPPSGPWTRLTAGLVLAMGIATGTLLVLGNLHLLGKWPVLAVLVAGLLATLAAERRFGRPADDTPTEHVTAALSTIAGASMGAALGLWFGRPGWAGTAFCYDDITYHAAVVAHWLQWGYIDYAPFTYQSYYAFNSELLSLWFMVPTGDLTHGSVAVLLFVGLIVCATLSIAETHDIPPAPTMALLAAMFASHRLLYFSRTFSSTDLATTAYVLAALAFAVRPPTLRDALWCGLVGGLAIGTKVSAVPSLGLIGLWWLWRARKGELRWPVVFAASLLVFGSFWYVRNLILTGNPLFPAEIGPFAGPLEPEAARKTALIHFMRKDGNTLGWWVDLIEGRLNWPLFLGIPALIGYLAALWAGLSKDRRGFWLVAAVGIAFLLLHPFQPFSATINRPNAKLHSMVRYTTLVFVLGLPLLASVTRKGRWLGSILATAALVGFTAAVYYGTQKSYGTADTLWLLAGASTALIAMGLAGSAPRGTVAAFACVAVLVMGIRTPQKREFTNTRRSAFSPMGKLHKKAWAVVDALPDRSYIAWMSDMPPTHGFNLPLLGDHLQHHLIPVDRHGRGVVEPYHERWRNEPKRWWWQFSNKPREDVPVMQNLLTTGADFLVLSRCHQSAKGGWPRPHAGLVATNSKARLYGDRCVEIWDVEAIRDQELKEAVRRSKPAPKKKKKKKKSPPPEEKG